MKPQRYIGERLAGYAGEVSAFLRRRRMAQRPFARLQYEDGAGLSLSPEEEAGRALFLAAAKLIDLSR